MKYTDEEDKEKIRSAFIVFLAQNKLNLKKFVREYVKEKTYNQVYPKIYKNHIKHSYIESLAQLVNSTAKLEKFSNTFMITFKNSLDGK